jgi:hypothetical protein
VDETQVFENSGSGTQSGSLALGRDKMDRKRQICCEKWPSRLNLFKVLDKTGCVDGGALAGSPR